jgi:FtsP/CotA-like multicopper oxidase with cupredoxin domain
MQPTVAAFWRAIGAPPPRRGAGRAAVAVLAASLLLSHSDAADAAQPSALPPVLANDNTSPAGIADGETVSIRLRAAVGRWQPEGPGGPALTVDAFGEEHGALMVPAPLIRVTEGASLDVTIDNELSTPLRVHGLCARDGAPCAPIDVPAGDTARVRFASGRAGTYHYWATSIGAPMPVRELAGALVVDPRGPVAHDRVFVITEWNSLTAEHVRDILAADDPGERFLAVGPRLTFVINGLSWPATERLTYRRGDAVRWRVINVSSQPHPMHLHGFYFTVMTTGDGRRDEPVAEGEGRHVVTHLLPSGGTMSLTWTPREDGNWLFHCHIMGHVSPSRSLARNSATSGTHASHGAHAHVQGDASLGMAGMVLGITVLPPLEAPAVEKPPPVAARQLTMVIERTTAAAKDGGAIGIAIADQRDAPAGLRVSSPGPPLVLRRGELVEITVVNRLEEPTAIHWHGLEIESYYDGVHGWSGSPGRTAPIIEPGRSFLVRIVPPRAGTFIYHTHLHDYRQLSSGLYGPVIVTGDEPYDPALDHVIVLGRRDASEASGILQEASSVVVNGLRMPRWTWRAGARHRVRLINITPDDVLEVTLVRDTPMTWHPLAKDGAPVPSTERQPRPARARIAVGETYDFEVDAPAARGAFWVEVRTTNGRWQAQGQVLVR